MAMTKADLARFGDLLDEVRKKDQALAEAREIIEECEVADLRRLGLLDKACAWLEAHPAPVKETSDADR
jgi:hypothetical protein